MLPQSQVSLASLIAWDLWNSDCPFFLKASIGYSFSLQASPTITGAAWLVTISSPRAASAGFSRSQSSKSQLVRWGAASPGCSCRARHQHPPDTAPFLCHHNPVYTAGTHWGPASCSWPRACFWSPSLHREGVWGVSAWAGAGPGCDMLPTSRRNTPTADSPRENS